LQQDTEIRRMRTRFNITMDPAVLVRLDAAAGEVGAARSHLIESAVLAHLDGTDPAGVSARARALTAAGAAGKSLPMTTRPINSTRKGAMQPAKVEEEVQGTDARVSLEGLARQPAVLA
jgi:hypothetical protein